MDLDALAADRKADWERLETLAASRRLDGAEADDLIAGYQQAAADLSEVQSRVGSSLVGDRLGVLLSRARLRLAGSGGRLGAAVPRFVLIEAPAALYRTRWTSLGAAALTVLVAVLFAWWALGDPRVLANFGDEQQLDQLAEHDFVNYYSENPAASFAGQVWTNNAWVAAQCLVLGITGVFVPAVLISNAMNVGVSAAVLISRGYGETFWTSILPHGLLELTAIFFAAGAGILLFWRVLVPGARPRAVAVAEEARGLFTVAIALAGALFVSGLIEGFITRQPWPWPIKIGIGAVALAGFLVYVLVLGRRAVRAGETGDVAEAEAGARRRYAG